MTNTYAMNVTRQQEFSVEQELKDIGLHPWVPRRLASRYVKEKREAVWYDVPYVHKLIFCVIPAIYWRDVVELKHVIGKPVGLSRRDLEGVPAHRKSYIEGGPLVPTVPGLKQFKAAVEAEYADMQRRKENSEYQCRFTPGQAVELLEGPFAGMPAVFKSTVRRAHDEYAKLRVEADVFGRAVSVDVDPDKVREYH